MHLLLLFASQGAGGLPPGDSSPGVAAIQVAIIAAMVK